MSAETGEAMLKNASAVAIPKDIDFMIATSLDGNGAWRQIDVAMPDLEGRIGRNV
jgi:hypothetical protein